MGAFQALIKMIDDMAWGLEKRYLPNRATPDEQRIRLAYGQAYADLWHKATKKRITFTITTGNSSANFLLGYFRRASAMCIPNPTPRQRSITRRIAQRCRVHW